MSSNMAKVLLVLFSAAGCAASPSEVGNLAQAELVDDEEPGKKNQGESLRGTQLTSSGDLVAFGYEFALGSITSLPSLRLHLEGGQLVSQFVQHDDDGVPHLVYVSGKKLVGARLVGYSADGTPSDVYIHSVDTIEGSPLTNAYDVRLGSPKGPSLCAGSAEEQYAIPLRGTWNERGYHVDDPTRFTFACWRGVLSKCYRWGYRPWSYKDGQSLEPYFQACTRMARADICGDGIAHTVDGTWIDGYDRFSVDSSGGLEGNGILDFANQPAMLIEAAWGPDAADGSSGGALCLSKLRWSTIPLDPDCRARIPLCDGETPAQWLTSSALLFSNSPVTDVALHSCGDPNNPPSVCPAGNPNMSVSNLLEGSLYHPELKQKWRPSTKALYRYTLDGKEVTTSDTQPPIGYSNASKVLLGYILTTPSTSTARPLYRYRFGGGFFQWPPPHYLTTSDASNVPSGANDVQFEGYLPR